MLFQISLTILTVTTAIIIKLQHKTGTVYEQINNAAFYQEKVKTTINIGIPSPRVLLDHKDRIYNHCNTKWSAGSVGLCDVMFGTFDEEIDRFLDLDLIDNVNHLSRSTRAVATATIVVITGVIWIATVISGYFIGAAVSNRDMDEFREEQQIFREQMGLVRTQVNLTNYNLMDVVDTISLENDPIVLSNDPIVPLDILAEKAMLGGIGHKSGLQSSQQENTWHILKLNTRESDKFKTSILTLQNNRLPLEEPFLIGMRTQCLALQKQKTEREIQFCTDFAFYSNRWDTSLHFEGLGFSYFNFELPRRNNGQNHSVIKEVVYSFNTEIPVLEQNEFPQFRIRNLGRFVTQGTLQITKMPNYAILDSNQILKPLEKNQCSNFGKLELCSSISVLRYDDCLHKNFNGHESTRCKTVDFSVQTTCLSSLGESFVVVSMTQNSTISNHEKSPQTSKVRNVSAFDIVNRNLKDESISCVKNEIEHFLPIIQIPKFPRKAKYNYTVEHLNSEFIEFERTKTVDHDIAEIHRRITNENSMLEKSFNMTQNELKNFKLHQNSTLEYMKTNIKQTAENALESTIKFFLPYIVSALAGIGILLLLWAILAFGCRAICKNQKKYSGRPIIQPWVPTTTTIQTDEQTV